MTIDRSSRRSPRACHGRLVPVGWSLRHAVALAPAPRRSPLDPPAAPSGSTCHRRPERAAGRLPRSLQQSPIQSLPRTAGPERARTGGPNNPAPTVPHHQVDQRRRPHQRVPNCSLTGHDTVSGTHTLDTGLNRCDHEGGCVSPRRVPCPPWSVLLSNTSRMRREKGTPMDTPSETTNVRAADSSFGGCGPCLRTLVGTDRFGDGHGR